MDNLWWKSCQITETPTEGLGTDLITCFGGVLGVPATGSWRILLRMNFTSHHRNHDNRGFTIIELLVVIAIIILIAALLLPALGKAFRSAHSTEDKTQVRGIHSAMMLFASGNESKFPRPSVVAKNYEDILHDTTDTTGNLMSFMIARGYFNTDLVISPVETNPNIRDMNEVLLAYDYDSIDGEEVIWDDQFEGDIELASATSPAHNSYAHQALCGQRVRLKWHSGAGSSDIILANRGPRDGDVGTTGDMESFTLKFHSSEDAWAGNVVMGDGSSKMVESVFPDGIAYQPLNGYPLGPDNIFFPDWNDVVVGGIDEGILSGDNWMVICNNVTEEPGADGKFYDVVNPVWD